MARDKNDIDLQPGDLVSVPCRVLRVDPHCVGLQTIETDTQFVLRGMHVIKELELKEPEQSPTPNETAPEQKEG